MRCRVPIFMNGAFIVKTHNVNWKYLEHSAFIFSPGLLHGDALGQVAREVYRATPFFRRIIGEQLHGNGIQNR